MPGLEDWVNAPIDIIQSLYANSNNGESLQSRVSEYFSNKLSGDESLSWIPSLNDVPQHDIKHHSLVRFRCMIQDMFDPEYYLGVYEVRNKKTGQTNLKSGMYRDIADCKEGEEINVNSMNNVNCDRQTFYCVPIPGENEWVKKVYASTSKAHVPASISSKQGGQKRTLDDTNNVKNMDSMETDSTDVTLTNNSDSANASGDDPKKSKITQGKEKDKKTGPPDLNFPLPDETGPACLVKVYHDYESFKVNDIVEFIGVLSNDPSMVNFPEEKQGDSEFIVDASEMESTEEQNAHCPPPSLVPRLHAVLARRLTHSNPHVPVDITEDKSKAEVEGFISGLNETKSQVLGVLEEALFGDKLAAEYLLCHLIAHVYNRRDVTAVGNFTLNLSNVPQNSEFPELLYSLLQNLVTKSYMLQMTLEKMNKLKFTPQKDYNANRLVSGILQLSDGTHLVLDETAMQAGQLDADGVRNITALGNVVKWQKVEYNFVYHKQDFPCNLNVLIMSEGRSIIQCTAQVPIKAVQSTDNIVERYRGINHQLTSSLLSTIQTYLSLVKLLPYSVPDQLSKEIEEDFVDMRKDNNNSLTVESFQTMLTLARLLALGSGKSSLTLDLWEKAKSMELQRKSRITPPSAIAAES